MSRRSAVLVVVALLGQAPALAQSITTEAAVTTGVSTDDVAALATQIRAFGEGPSQIRYFVEAAWARNQGAVTDAFGAAYPYKNRLQVMEAYGQWFASSARAIASVRAGRFRVPFGISDGSDHAYNGFLRAPLIRYDNYYALSNNFLEHGVDVVAGVPRLTVETALGAPADTGDAIRRPGLDKIVRVQGVLGTAIVGVSHIRTLPYQPARFAFGNTVFTGVDVRWMRTGVQLRGEWIGGRPFDGTTTTGWYADAIVHHRRMGRVTAVARVEELDYDTPSRFAMFSKRKTAGARIALLDGMSAQVNLMRHSGLADQTRRTSLDVGLTYSIRH